MISRQVLYDGHVQGVGFRYSVCQVATGYDVKGWVKNLDDGRVELQVCGDPGEVSAFLKGIQESHLGGLIRNTEQHDIAPLGDMRGFEIRH